MNVNKLSIKKLTTVVLLSFGVVVMTLAGVAMKEMRDTALRSQARSLSRVIEVSVRKSMEELDGLAHDLGVYTKKTEGFRDTAQQLTSNPNDSALAAHMAEILDEQFHQRYVTSSIVDLRKIRIYNLDLKLVAQSNEGDSLLASRLPETLYAKAGIRKGADRLKMLTSLWVNNHDTLYSILLPVGGLRQTGYMEIVLRPAHNLKSIEHTIKLPLEIQSMDKQDLYKSENWEAAATAASLPIHFELEADDGRTALHFRVLEDMKLFHERLNYTQSVMTGLFVVITGLFLFGFMWVLSRYLFKPATRLAAAIEKCADGDLSVDIESKGIKELHTLSRALAVLVDKLRLQVSVISNESENLVVSASNLAITTRESEQVLHQQRQETDHVATSINEMSASAVEVSKNAERVAAAAGDAEREALNGQDVVGQTVSSIDDLASEVEHATEVMHKLKGESENIGTVLDVIRSIADQTNLLALNAAIEAARAGDQGRGFAVVADEVRTLASRTQQSTQEIQHMIESLQQGTQEAVRVMDKSRDMTRKSVEFAGEAGSYLGTITRSVGDISSMTMQIATASQQQSTVIEAINQSVAAITDLANKTSEGAEHVTENTMQLTAMATNLKQLVRHFKLHD